MRKLSFAQIVMSLMIWTFVIWAVWSLWSIGMFDNFRYFLPWLRRNYGVLLVTFAVGFWVGHKHGPKEKLGNREVLVTLATIFGAGWAVWWLQNSEGDGAVCVFSCCLGWGIGYTIAFDARSRRKT
jgi:hypothetical protein